MHPQGDLFYSAGLHRNHVLATTKTGEIVRGFGKNAGEWTGRVDIARKKPWHTMNKTLNIRQH